MESMNKPEVVARRIQGTRKANQKPEYRKMRSAIMKALCADPIKGPVRIARFFENLHKPGVNDRRIQGLRQAKQKQEHRHKMSAIMKALYADPIKGAQMRAAAKAKRPKLPPIIINHWVNRETGEVIDIEDPQAKTPLEQMEIEEAEREAETRMSGLPQALTRLKLENPSAFRVICQEFGVEEATLSSPITEISEAETEALYLEGMAFLRQFMDSEL
jgi:hypothetical protein